MTNIYYNVRFLFTTNQRAISSAHFYSATADAFHFIILGNMQIN